MEDAYPPPTPPAETPPDFELGSKDVDEIIAGWRPLAEEWERDYEAGNYEYVGNSYEFTSPSRRAQDSYVHGVREVVRGDQDRASELLYKLGDSVARQSLPDPEERKTASLDQRLLGKLLIDFALQFPDHRDLLKRIWVESIGQGDSESTANEALRDAMIHQKLPMDYLRGVVNHLAASYNSLNEQTQHAKSPGLVAEKAAHLRNHRPLVIPAQYRP